MHAVAACEAFIALGSNLDEPARQVRTALAAIDRLPLTSVLKCSSLYRTPPWGDTEQPDFINAVAQLRTGLDPDRLLAHLLVIESAMGRVRTHRFGPRVIDLDLLRHGAARIETAELWLPHPRMHERAFVMLPLSEIAPRLELDGHGQAAAIAARLDATGIVRVSEAADPT